MSERFNISASLLFVTNTRVIWKIEYDSLDLIIININVWRPAK